MMLRPVILLQIDIQGKVDLQFLIINGSEPPRIDTAGELFRNIVRTAEGPLNPSNLILLANYFVTL